MSLPNGVSVATVTFGRALSALGTPAVISATVTLDRPIVWAATGEALYATPDPVVETPGGFLSFQLPHVDQPGFLDAAGNAVTDFAYVLVAEIRFGKRTVQNVTKAFQVRVGQDTVDLDLVPTGSIVPAVTAPGPVVLSVAGQTGAVTATELASALGVVSVEELSATFARGADVITPAGNALEVALQSSLPAVLIVQGDSTGNDPVDEWVGRLTSKLAAAYADHRVIHRLWNMATLSYDTPRVIQPATEGYLTPSATDLAYLQDTTVTQITGDLTIRAKVRAVDVDAVATRAIGAVFEGATATNAWRLYIATAGLTLSWAETGGAATRTVVLASMAQLTAAFSDGVDFYIGAELDVDNGAGQYVARGLTSSDGVTWTTLGTPVTGTTGPSSVNASTGHLKPGARGTTTGNADQWAGRVYWLEVAAGIGAAAAIRARFEPGLASARSSSWVSAEGHTWVRSTNGLTVGAPLLLVLNASSPGLDADYSVTNFAAQAGVQSTLAILNYSHNGPTMIQEPDYAGVKFAPLLDKWKATWPNVPVLVTLQNPQRAPRDAGSIEDHARRVRGVARLAAARGLPTINVFSALAADPGYLLPDGIHPSSAGSAVWTEVVRKMLSPAIPTA